MELLNEKIDLVSALERKQRAEQLTERAFAAKLGIQGGYWNLIKHGKRRIGGKTLSGIVRAYPDLHHLVIQYHNEALNSVPAA